MPPHSGARSINELYSATLQAHVENIARHATANGFDATPFSPSFVAPDTFWTAKEKAIFFHSLSRHSRLRPDLIADCIPTKSFLEVCGYLDALENASKDVARDANGRKNIPAAREMSSRWVGFENRMAEMIRFDQLEADKRALLAARRKVLKEEKLASQPGGSDVSGGSKSRKRSRDKAQDHGPERNRACKENWEREDFLQKLNRDRLFTLDHIIRRSETPLIPTPVPSTPINESIEQEMQQALSKVEQTRLRKRLHMRRKRAAEKAGTNEASYDTTAKRLRVGRKPKTQTQDEPPDGMSGCY